MKTIEINKSNWSGENGTVELFEDGRTFRIWDEKFRVVAKHNEAFIDEETGEEIVPAHDEYSLEHKDLSEWRDMDCHGSDDWIEGHGYYFHNWTGEIERRDEDDIRLAAAKLIFNIF